MQKTATEYTAWKKVPENSKGLSTYPTGQPSDISKALLTCDSPLQVAAILTRVLGSVCYHKKYGRMIIEKLIPCNSCRGVACKRLAWLAGIGPSRKKEVCPYSELGTKLLTPIMKDDRHFIAEGVDKWEKGDYTKGMRREDYTIATDFELD